MSIKDTTVSRMYSGFRGVDFRGDDVSLNRSPDALNVWKDYRETDSVRTRPKEELFSDFDGIVYGVFFFNGNVMVHCGDKLYKVKNGAKSIVCDGLAERESNAFVFEEKWYFKDGKNYLVYDGENIGSPDAYIPTTSIARAPESGGRPYEDINFLTPLRKNTFLRTEDGKIFWLDAQKIDTDYEPIVEIVNKETLEYEPVTEPYIVDYEKGHIIFEQPPKDSNHELTNRTVGQDDLRVTFSKTIKGYSDVIPECTLLQVFDNRVFFSGNPKYPNTVYHCSLEDPSYCSDTDYYREGLDKAAVTGMVAGNNALWVFRESSEENTNVFYHTPTLDEQYGKIYPSSHSSIALGCVGKAINFNDDICFFSERGMEGISGDITTEQVAAHRSSLIDRKMLSEKDYKKMVLAEWEGYLLVFIGKNAYLADSRAAFSNENHMEYDWFYWELDHSVTCANVKDGVLYIGTEGGVYTLTDFDGDVDSYWTTPKDKFKYPHKLKTTNKRGCVAEGTGDVSVYAKTEDSDFELVGEFAKVSDFFVSRVKRKKFKDIQLKFATKTWFSLESVTLECFIGGYIKR